MKPSEIRALNLLRSSLKNQSFKRYAYVLGQLLESHRHYSMLQPLSDAVRRRDWASAYAAADSLSSQKYDDATQHFVANQFALLVKKYPFPKGVLDLQPEDRATKTFLTAEKRMGLVNRKFAFLNHSRSRDRFREHAVAARRWIRTLLGSTPSYQSIWNQGDFGSGASLGVHGNATHMLAKLLSEKWSVTPGALHHGFAVLMNNHHYLEQLLPKGPDGVMLCYDYEYAFEAYKRRCHVVNNNKLSFVPKTAKTHRVIAVEPLLNGLVQKGIDLEMRKRLKRAGIDLRSQERNQLMAREGSIADGDESFVTIDLSSASDSVSAELVRYLLPDDWFRLLDRTRSKYYSLHDLVTRYNKFCSMGNGFCFPLETLIFASACFALGCGKPGVDFMVYGDDIIVRKKHAPGVLQLLAHWGFKVNADKTFLEGPFRESCGSDWFGGQDVRPFTLDYALDSLENLFKFLNLSRRSERTAMFFSGVRGTIVRLIPDKFLFYRPLPGNADSGIDATGDEHLTSPHCKYHPGNCSWSWKELIHVPITDFDRIEACKDQPWLISAALRGSASIPRGALAGLPDVTFRVKTRAKVVRKGYSSTSNWLPTSRTR